MNDHCLNCEPSSYVPEGCDGTCVCHDESVAECHFCDGTGYVDDLSACGDPDHCSPWTVCGSCDGHKRV